MAEEQQQHSKDVIEPGMLIEAANGDLGEKDVSKPRVIDVVRDVQGHVEEVVMQSFSNNHKIMGMHRLSFLVNVGVIVTVLVMASAALLLFYGLATGQTGS